MAVNIQPGSHGQTEKIEIMENRKDSTGSPKSFIFRPTENADHFACGDTQRDLMSSEVESWAEDWK